MKKQQIIKNVNSILQDTTGIFISNSEGLCDINNKIIQKGDYFNTSNNYIYGYDKEITIVKIENVLKKISTGYTSGCKIFSNNDIICYKLILKENSVEYLLINDDGTTIFRVTGRNIPIHKENDKIVFTDKKQQIFLYNITNGSILWSYSLLEGFKIEGKIYLYDNILVVNQIDEQSCSIMVGLDILTGKKLWENKVSLIHYKQKNDFLYGFASNTFGDNVFSKINIKTGEVFEKSFENFAKQVASHLATIHNDNLYFSAYKIGEIGIIDLQKQEITQEFSLNLEKGVGIGAPVVTEDKIYILDSLNTLHIFEK